MIFGFASHLRAAAEEGFREAVLRVTVVLAVGLFAAVSLGFGTFAAYDYVRESEGRVVAALIIGAAYGLTAIAICAIGMARRLRRSASASTAPGNVEPLLESMTAAGTSQDPLALIAMRLGRELTPIQLLALALLGGFIAGRKLRK